MKKQELNETIKELLKLIEPNGNPNINVVNELLRDIPAIRLNIKNMGYELARSLRKALPIKEVNSPKIVGLKSKASTQKDMESEWLWYWTSKIKSPLIYHRKIWELCYIPQAIHEYHGFKPDIKGIGFGCGEEPLPSLFASMGAKITITDLHPDDVKGKGWVETNQHTSDIEKTWFSDIVDKETFFKNVNLRYVDMNSIPSELNGQYNFCWSVCALEHLGSIKNGLDFIINSLNVLKPGGVAVHTTEFNCFNDKETIDNWPTVLFQRQHFEQLANDLRDDGYTVMDLDFNFGNGVMDRFVDIPPYAFGEGWLSRDGFGDVNQAAHMKLSVDGFVCTCFGLIIKKPLD